MRELELLAPAGNLEIFKGVIDAGADAVYFGGSMFSARAYAANFDYKESALALKYAHIHGKKAYLTLNTLIKNKEFDDLVHDYVKFYYENGLDGIIVQDIGLIKYIRENFPDLNVHGSTQLAVCNSYGANLFKELGLTRIVPARELSLRELRKIHNETGMKIEAFVHGALCYSYSGDCLMSSIIGGRSGNRGRCAQPCRLEYDVLYNGKKINSKCGYVLSLKDLCTVSDLPYLYGSGVSSLKIEGRMKKKQYAQGVVNVYRKYVDILLDNIAKGNSDYSVDKTDFDLLMKLGNRSGFTNSYYYNKADNMVTFSKPSFENESIDNEFTEDKLKASCKFEAKINKPIEITVNYQDYIISKTGCICKRAENRPLNDTDITKRLSKTKNSHFVFTDILLDVDDDIFVPLGDINRLRKEALDDLENDILSKYNREYDSSEEIDLFNEYFESKANIDIGSSHNDNISNIMISINNMSQLKGIEASLDRDYDLIIPFIDKELFRDFDIIKDISHANRIFVEFPIVIRDNSIRQLEDNIELLNRYDGYVISSYDALGFVRKHKLCGTIIAGSHLYTYNNTAVKCIENLKIAYNICPIELNNKELSHRNNTNSIITIYGRAPLMISANCINKNLCGCDNKEKVLTLRDKKGHEFLVLNKCKVCYNVIYNGFCTCLFNELNLVDKLGFKCVRLDFVDEDEAKVADILKQYINCLNNNDKVSFEYTKAHFNRGVE